MIKCNFHITHVVEVYFCLAETTCAKLACLRKHKHEIDFLSMLKI